MVGVLAAKGICSETVLRAFQAVPRHLFVSEALRFRAYEDISLPIGFGQTMSRPSTVARLIQGFNLTGKERVLEVGTGSGYQTAVLATLASSVVTVEIVEELFQRARDVLLFKLGFRNIQIFRTSDYTIKLAEYDAIVVSACADEISEEYLLQLSPGGTMMIPVREKSGQVIKRVFKDSYGKVHAEEFGKARFVPLARNI